MKTYIKSAVLTLVVAFGLTGCADDLVIENPNNPTPAVLNTEEGLRRQASGIYSAIGGDYYWRGITLLEGMGDAIPSRVGNFGFVDTHNPEQIFYSDGSTHRPIDTRSGETNPAFLARVNSRTSAEPTVLYLWQQMYRINNEANLILKTLDGGQVKFTGDAAAKEKGFRAWASFWKGFAYAHIASLYEKGLIIDVYGETNNSYKNTAEMVAEAGRLFDVAAQNASGFDLVASAIVPDLFVGVGIAKPTGASLAAAANTMKARTLLVNKYRDQMTAADWQQIESLTAQGLASNVGAPVLRFDQTTYGGTGQILNRTAGVGGGGVWSYISERLIQEFDPADQRLTASFFQKDGNKDGVPDFVYTGDRGWNHITTWNGRDPVFEVIVGASKLFLVSAEENLLMAAEAKLALGKKGEAAELVNQVRTMQAAGLPALTADTIDFETIRRERRTALIARGLSFYDARRLRTILPKAQGGGRQGAWVWKKDATGKIVGLDKNAEIVYNFLPYWPVPVHELTFNPPGTGADGGVK